MVGAYPLQPSLGQPELSEVLCHTVQRNGRKDHCLFEL
jgi:hypothetical protein